jgi:hypothetical protein
MSRLNKGIYGSPRGEVVDGLFRPWYKSVPVAYLEIQSPFGQSRPSILGKPFDTRMLLGFGGKKLPLLSVSVSGRDSLCLLEARITNHLMG